MGLGMPSAGLCIGIAAVSRRCRIFPGLYPCFTGDIMPVALCWNFELLPDSVCEFASGIEARAPLEIYGWIGVDAGLINHDL